jgi:hypothetical protein
MSESLASLKREARRAVHDTLGTPALYSDAAHTTPVPLRVRWHGRQSLLGAGDAPGFASTVETVEKIVFDREELQALGLTPIRDGVVVLPDFVRTDGQPFMVRLDNREPYNGPVNVTWQAARDI